jgi:hypothetical protein
MIVKIGRQALDGFLAAVGYFLGNREMIRKHTTSPSRYPGDLRDFY